MIGHRKSYSKLIAELKLLYLYLYWHIATHHAARTHAHARTRARAHTRTHTHTHTHTTHTHRHTDTRTHGHTDTQTHRHTDTQTHKHTDTQAHRHTNTQTHRHTNTDTNTNTNTHHAPTVHLLRAQGGNIRVHMYGARVLCTSSQPRRRTAQWGWGQRAPEVGERLTSVRMHMCKHVCMLCIYLYLLYVCVEIRGRNND